MKKVMLLFAILTFNSSFANEDSTHVLILGDSLTEGYGVSKEEAFPAVLEKLLVKHNVKVTNSGISGSTSASGVKRLNWLVKGDKIDYLILALGSNDGLRGFKPVVTEKNLEDTILFAQKNNIKVILSGLKMPPNYSKKYQKEFEQIFISLSKKFKIPMIPFLLKNVAGNKELNLADGIHPNAKGHKIIAKNVFKTLNPLLEK